MEDQRQGPLIFGLFSGHFFACFGRVFWLLSSGFFWLLVVLTRNTVCCDLESVDHFTEDGAGVLRLESLFGHQG